MQEVSHKHALIAAKVACKRNHGCFFAREGQQGV